MRIPDGAPVPFWLGVRRKLPYFNKSGAKPTVGSVAVVGTVLLTAAAVFAVCIYPKVNNEYYKESQKRERALIQASRDELAHGQRAWSDPFDRK